MAFAVADLAVGCDCQYRESSRALVVQPRASYEYHLSTKAENFSDALHRHTRQIKVDLAFEFGLHLFGLWMRLKQNHVEGNHNF